MKRPRMDVNLEELDRIIERGTHAPLSESENEKLKSALHALAGMLPQPRSTEKTKNVLEQSAASAPENEPEPAKGHGRNGASSYTGAQKVAVRIRNYTRAILARAVKKGKSIRRKNLGLLVRIVGQAPLAATVYELDRLRCNLCGEVFTAPEPEGIGPEKYDETTAAMIALLKYGSGMPFYRLEKLEQALGIPLPASTQWEIVEDEAELIQAARDELIRQAAQGEVLHNDDTSHARTTFGARTVGRPHRRVHLRHRVHTTRTPDRLVLHRPPARRRESARCAPTPRRGSRPASADV